MLVVEGSVANEEINGEGHWSGFGVDAEGQPITASTWIDRLAPRAAVVMALGTCAAYGGVPAMRNNPTGAMGLRDHLGHGFVSRRGRPLINLPGCPVQPDAITETLQRIALEIAGVSPPTELDDQGRPLWLFEQTAHETCDRAGLAEHGRFAETLADHGTCLAKVGCAGPGGQVQRAGARLGQRRRRLPQRRRHLHRLHDARLPRPLPAVHGHRARSCA